MLCYPFSLSVVKEMLSRGQTVPGLLAGFGDLSSQEQSEISSGDLLDEDRAQIVRCY